MPAQALHPHSGHQLTASFYEILGLPAPTLNGGSGDNLQITAQIVKKAYHKALLRWHPDKAAIPSLQSSFKTTSSPPAVPPKSPARASAPEFNAAVTNGIPSPAITSPCTPSTPTAAATVTVTLPTPTPEFTLDQILTAYTTLSTEKGRRQYEREYRLSLLHAKQQLQQTAKESVVSNVPTDSVDLHDFVYHEQWGRFTKGCRCGEEEGYVILEKDLEDGLEGTEGGKGDVVVGCVGCSLWIKVGFAVVPEGVGDERDALGAMVPEGEKVVTGLAGFGETR